MSTSYAKELEAAEKAALRAGEMLRADFYRKNGARGRGYDADVDIEAEREIREILLKIHPSWGFRGEETGEIEGTDEDGHRWLVDPNDGTSAYLEGYRGSAVSIALVRDESLVLGVIYAPLAPDDRGDLFTWAEGCGPMRRNGQEVLPRIFPEKMSRQDIVFVSHEADTRSWLNARLVHPARFIAVPGIAYRLALVAAGDGVATVTLSGPTDYDYAGGHALLQSAGGAFIGKEGSPVTYSTAEPTCSPWYFGGAPGIVEKLRKKRWDSISEPAERDRSAYQLLKARKIRKKHDPGVLERGQGCLVGQLAGDAIGSLVEFMDPAAIKKKYPRRVREMLDGGAYNTIAGQPTDDSELALMLARSILKKGGFDAEEAAHAYAFWYNSDPFDMGLTIQKALEAAADSPRALHLESARKAADRSKQSNGSLMRISPLGIWGHALAPDTLAGYAREDSSITHPHKVCRDACAVFVVAIARGIAMGKGAEDVYHHALDYAEKSACPEIVQTMRDAASAPPPDFMVQSGWVRLALQNAFYQLLHAKTLEEGVVDTVMRGGDTDTNAAIAGALLGAVYGRSAIPRQWQQMVLSCRPIQGLQSVHQPRPRPLWPVDALEIAEQLLGI